MEFGGFDFENNEIGILLYQSEAESFYEAFKRVF